MPRNSEILRIAALLFLLSGNKSFQITSLAEDLHRITNIINKLDSLGQMALNPVPVASPLLENLGPVISALSTVQTQEKEESDHENLNAIF